MTTTRSLDAVFFDFGGVFMDSPFAAMETFATSLGVEYHTLLNTVFGPYDDDTDHPWHRLERGEIDLDTAVAEIKVIAAEHGLADIDVFGGMMSLTKDPTDRSFMVEAVRALRSAGIRTSIITNNLKEFSSVWRKVIPVDELFDDVVDSCEVGLRKPNVAIYELALDRLGVEPGRSVFLDDFEPNVIAARKVGMHGLWCGYENETSRAAAAELLRLAGLH